MKKYLLLIGMILLSSCSQHHKVHCYKIHLNHGASADIPTPAPTTNQDDYLYWYVMNMNNNECYYASSRTPLTATTSIKSISWTLSKQGVPKELEEEIQDKDAKELTEESLEEDKLPQEMQTELEQEGSPEAETGEVGGEGDIGASDASSDGGGASDGGGGDGGGDGGGGD